MTTMVTKTCPYCHSSTNAVPLQSSEEGLVDEVAHIRNERRRLDGLIAALQRRLNEIQSPASVFPPETLALIFEYVCSTQYSGSRPEEPAKRKRPQMTLGAVSSSWRQVVWSNPRLWTSIYVVFYPQSMRESVQVLRLFLGNSGRLPLAVDLDWYNDYDRSHASALVDPVIDELLIENLPRIRELRLTQPPPVWFSFTHCLPQLTVLSINHSSCINFRTRDPDLLFPNSPLVRRLSLHDAVREPSTKVDLPWHMISSVNISSVPIQVCIKLLVQCPNLTEYLGKSPRLVRETSEVPRLPSPLVLQHMKSFCWGAFPDPLNHTLLQSIRLPSLRTLRWTHEANLEIPQSFFRGLPPTLSTLQLDSGDPWVPSYGGLIHKCHSDIDHVEHLILANFYTHDILGILFELQHGNGILPRLNTLTIQGCRDSTKWSIKGRTGCLAPQVTARVTDVLVERVHSNGGQFNLIVDFIRICWTDRDKERLKGANKDQRLNIIEGSKRVTWL